MTNDQFISTSTFSMFEIHVTSSLHLCYISTNFSWFHLFIRYLFLCSLFISYHLLYYVYVSAVFNHHLSIYIQFNCYFTPFFQSCLFLNLHNSSCRISPKISISFSSPKFPYLFHMVLLRNFITTTSTSLCSSSFSVSFFFCLKYFFFLIESSTLSSTSTSTASHQIHVQWTDDWSLLVFQLFLRTPYYVEDPMKFLLMVRVRVFLVWGT